MFLAADMIIQLSGTEGHCFCQQAWMLGSAVQL